MKNEILERAMFAMPLSKDARNSGIMAGFEDEMPEDTEDAAMEEMPPMARTPQNPEILMNTLRGDMRSLDARYQELAQMVGEDAAMETPPEVLAMLQPQLAAPAAGIGALPQAQGMMPPNMGMPPPGAGMPPPDQMGAPQPAPAMPQGGIPMPAGMESAPPFSPGAEEAPPTPDGMPPIRANVGMIITPAMRMAQIAGNKVGQVGSAANAALGRMFMNPQGITQPVLENVRGPGGRYTAEQVVRGGEALTAPTFTQGLQQGASQALTRLTDQYPRLSSMSGPAALALGLANIPRGGASQPGTDMSSQIPRDTIEDRVANSVLNKPPAVTMSFDQPFTTTAPDRYKITEGTRPPSSAAADLAATTAAEQAAVDERQVAASDKASADPLGAFINQKLKAFDERAAKGKPLSKMDRIKASQAEYAPLFEELLGSDKESAKINALLLLSEAGLKLASTTKPTFAMALADSFAGVPRGVAAIAAQERELAMKTKSASLQQAISDVGAEDAAAAARQKLVLEYTMKAELEKAKRGDGIIYKNAGAGGRIGEDKSGNFKGFFIDPESQDYKDIAENPVLVNNFTPVNPFAKDMGKATTVTAKSLKKREEIEEKMNLLTGLIAKVDTGLSQVTNAYSPGTFVNNLANNVVVPLVPNFILRPDVDQAATVATLSTVFSDITRGNAEVGGKLSVQGEKWARENLKSIQDPAGLLKNPELAAKVFGTIKTGYLNEYYALATQLGIGDRNIVVSTPPTGTKNDPFVIPKDGAGQQQMLNYLKIQFGAVDDPKAMIYVRNPDGKIASTPVQNLFKPVGQ